MQTAWGQISSNYLSVVCLDSNIDVKHLVGTYVHKEVISRYQHRKSRFETVWDKI